MRYKSRFWYAISIQVLVQALIQILVKDINLGFGMRYKSRFWCTILKSRLCLTIQVLVYGIKIQVLVCINLDFGIINLGFGIGFNQILVKDINLGFGIRYKSRFWCTILKSRLCLTIQVLVSIRFWFWYAISIQVLVYINLDFGKGY